MSSREVIGSDLHLRLPGMTQRMTNRVWTAAGRLTSILMEEHSGLEGGGGSGDGEGGKIILFLKKN